MSQSILVIEDDREIASTIIGMLEAAEYDVRHATNGIDGQKIIQAEEIDLVITDMMMPVLDGAELARALRSSETHRTIPIIMMTSLPSAVPRHQDLFDAILRKPFSPDLLLTALRGCLADTQRLRDDDGESTVGQ